MPEYLTPGVYVEEIEPGPRPIEGVPTSTAAFLGETERGPLRPRLVTSYKDYVDVYGGVFGAQQFMPYSVNGFFENGGRRAYVCRIIGSNATTASKIFGDFTVVAIGPGIWGRSVWVRIQDASAVDSDGNVGFRLKLAYWSAVPKFQVFDPFDDEQRLPRPQCMEDHDNLSVDPVSSNYFAKRLTEETTNGPLSALAALRRTSGMDTKPPNTGVNGELLDQKAIDDPNPLSADDYLGDAIGRRHELQGLRALELRQYRDVALVYAPHAPNNSVAIEQKLIQHSERLRSRFAVIDCEMTIDPPSLDPRVTNNWDTSYAGFYAPWIEIADSQTGAPIVVPPGGHVLGIYARSDAERGVHKAPANEVVLGALDVTYEINDRVQDTLNAQGVNVIRKFPGRDVFVWGARTLTSDSLWKYVNIRRLFIFIERSIDRGLQWVVFEPNDNLLWGRVKDTIRLFLRSQWRRGALLGRTEEEAFFVTCDRTTMTQDDILNGRLICEIGIAPVKPAEFVIFRICQLTGEAKG